MSQSAKQGMICIIKPISVEDGKNITHMATLIYLNKHMNIISSTTKEVARYG